MKRTVSLLGVAALLTLLLVLVATIPVVAKGGGKGKVKKEAKAESKAKVTICHKPGTPAQKTMALPVEAVPGHLAHGDTEGACPELLPVTPVLTGTIPTDTLKISICHKPGTPAEKVLIVSTDAITDHVGHGDYLGPCDGSPPPAPVPTDTVKVSICHKYGTPAQKVLWIDADSVQDHLDHGDTPGACPVEPPAAPEWLIWYEPTSLMPV